MDTDMNIEITLIPKIDYKAATTCPKCKIWPNWIDASGICSHCKVSDRRSRVKGLWETLADLFARNKKVQSIEGRSINVELGNTTKRGK